MINRTKLTIKLYQGDEYNRRLTLVDDNDVPYDLSGYGAVMEIRPVIRERDKTGKWTGVNPPMLRLEKGDGLTLDDQGNIDIFVSSERSYNLPSGQFKYDLELIDDDSVHTILYGDVRIIGEVTDSESPYLEFSETYKGLPGGGTTGQHLTKKSDEPYDAEWTDVPDGDGGGTPGKDGEGVPEGGTAGQVLAKVDDTDFNTEWIDQSGGSDVDLSNYYTKDEVYNKGEVDALIPDPVDLQPLIDRIDELETNYAELEAGLDKCCPPPPATTIVVSNQTLTWADLPVNDQPDNGSLVETNNGDGTYTYEADFEWDNSKAENNDFRLNWLVDVLQFKNNQLVTGVAAFANFQGESITALSGLDTSNLTSMYYMFVGCGMFDQPLNHFDTSNVTSMYYMFSSCATFNQPLDQWDVSQVDEMPGMFNQCMSFDQDLSMWCVPLIDARPSFFDSGAPIYGNAAKAPQWGVSC